jgi:hypothetical protein
MSANLEALVEVASGAAPIAQLDEAATAKAAAEAVEAVAASGVDEEMKMPAIHDPSVFHSSITDPSVTDAVNELAKNLPMSQSAAAERRRKGWVKKTWDERLEELKEYKMVHGDANVPTLSKENPSLGHWVHDQRKQYRLYNEKKQTAMTPHRIEQLEAVGFKWALQRHTTMRSWQERFEELKQYMAKHGNCNVPIRYKENASLGQWVSTQRQEYGAKQKGQKSNITDERIKTLEEIGFTWSLRDTSKMAPRKSWDAHFQSLVEFKEKNGHCDVRVRSKQHPTGSLGRWVEKQRHHYNSRAEDASAEPKITDEQIAKLEGLGFKWRVRNEKRSVVEKRERLRAEQDALKQEEGEGAAQVVEGQHLSIPDIGHEETAAAVAAEVAAAVAVEPDVAAAVAAAGELPEIRDVSDIHEGSLDVAV